MITEWMVGDVVEMPLAHGLREFGEISEIDATEYPNNPWVSVKTLRGSRSATMKTMKENGVIVVWRPNNKMQLTGRGF